MWYEGMCCHAGRGAETRYRYRRLGMRVKGWSARGEVAQEVRDASLAARMQRTWYGVLAVMEMSFRCFARWGSVQRTTVMQGWRAGRALLVDKRLAHHSLCGSPGGPAFPPCLPSTHHPSPSSTQPWHDAIAALVAACTYRHTARSTPEAAYLHTLLRENDLAPPQPTAPSPPPDHTPPPLQHAASASASASSTLHARPLPLPLSPVPSTAASAAPDVSQAAWDAAAIAGQDLSAAEGGTGGGGGKAAAAAGPFLPRSFCCPLSRPPRVMADPVELGDTGHVFDRGNITRWLQDHDSDPITGGYA